MWLIKMLLFLHVSVFVCLDDRYEYYYNEDQALNEYEQQYSGEFYNDFEDEFKKDTKTANKSLVRLCIVILILTSWY